MQDVEMTQDGTAKKLRSDIDPTNWFAPSEKKVVTQVSFANPEQDFFALLNRKDGDFAVTAIEGLISQIRQCVGPEGGPSFYVKARSCLLALREGCAQVEVCNTCI